MNENEIRARLNLHIANLLAELGMYKPLTATWESPAAAKVRRLPDHIQTLHGITFKSVARGLEGDGWSARLNAGDSTHYWTVEIEGVRLPESPSILTIDDVIRAVAKLKS